MHRKDCCLNFFKNSFRKHDRPTVFQAKGAAQQHHIEMYMLDEAEVSDVKEGRKGVMIVDNDEYELEFDDGKQGNILARQGISSARKSAQQVAFETNSSVVSENCSLDSI